MVESGQTLQFMGSRTCHFRSGYLEVTRSEEADKFQWLRKSWRSIILSQSLITNYRVFHRSTAVWYSRSSAVLDLPRISRIPSRPNTILHFWQLNLCVNCWTAPDSNCLHLSLIVTVSESGSLHQVCFIKNSACSNRQPQPQALKVYLWNSLKTLVTLHCVSLSNSKVKGLFFSFQTDKERTVAEVTQPFLFFFLMNDKVDNSQYVLLNITFGMKWKTNGARQILKQRLETIWRQE